MVGEGEPPRSGLRNPAAAVRSVGAAALVVQAIVLLLAVVPLKVLGGQRAGVAIGGVLALAVMSFALAGLLRHAWAWMWASAVPVVLFVMGLFSHVALSILAIVFCLLWLYVLHVRRSVLRGR